MSILIDADSRIIGVPSPQPEGCGIGKLDHAAPFRARYGAL